MIGIYKITNLDNGKCYIGKSEAMKGNDYGKNCKHSQEFKDYVSQRFKGRIMSKETRNKMSKSKNGIFTGIKRTGPLSDEHKLKLSIVGKGVFGKYERTQEIRDNQSQMISNHNKGRVWINNGSKNKFVQKDNIPEGFVLGKIYKGRKVI